MAKFSFNWKKYTFDFISIFIAVVSAFALNNWNDNRKINKAETKILAEISNGLEKDLADIELNNNGHKNGIRACSYWRRLVNGDSVANDSLQQNYGYLTRDFISIQNVSGYESLKSRGLEIIEDDSLRYQIIDLYEFDFKIISKLEEQYYEMQFQQNYFSHINDIIHPYLIFSEKGIPIGIEQPLQLSEEDKKLLMTYLWKIEVNRQMISDYYLILKKDIYELDNQIQNYLE